MQLSVEKYQAIRTNRGANLDEIDKLLIRSDRLKECFDKLRRLKSEKERIEEITKIVD